MKPAQVAVDIRSRPDERVVVAMVRKDFAESAAVESFERQVELHLRDGVFHLLKTEPLADTWTLGCRKQRRPGVRHHRPRHLHPLRVDSVPGQTLAAGVFDGIRFTPVEAFEDPVQTVADPSPRREGESTPHGFPFRGCLFLIFCRFGLVPIGLLHGLVVARRLGKRRRCGQAPSSCSSGGPSPGPGPVGER